MYSDLQILEFVNNDTSCTYTALWCKCMSR